MGGVVGEERGVTGWWEETGDEALKFDVSSEHVGIPLVLYPVMHFLQRLIMAVNLHPHLIAVHFRCSLIGAAHSRCKQELVTKRSR